MIPGRKGTVSDCLAEMGNIGKSQNVPGEAVQAF
jgi:hypothetical protein